MAEDTLFTRIVNHKIPADNLFRDERVTGSISPGFMNPVLISSQWHKEFDDLQSGIHDT